MQRRNGDLQGVEAPESIITIINVMVGDVDFRWASDENNEPTEIPRLRFGRQKLK